MSVTELKALAFDTQQDMARLQNNLQLIGQQIEKKMKEKENKNDGKKDKTRQN